MAAQNRHEEMNQEIIGQDEKSLGKANKWNQDLNCWDLLKEWEDQEQIEKRKERCLNWG